jgi:hypothetical protein
MYTRVTREQFEIEGETVIHSPTGAEFIPHSETADSVIIWTGDIGKPLSGGEVYLINDVLEMMRTVWRESARIRPHLEAATA